MVHSRLALNIFLLLFFACACNSDDGARLGAVMPEIKLLETPCREGGEPNLFLTEENEVLLSWVEYLDDTTDALYFARLRQGKWDSPLEIARGSNWFVNWADFPSIAAFDETGKKLAAHWLAMAGEGTYDYDVQIALSEDGGQSWSNPFIPHADGVKAEHGFVTILPAGGDMMYATWLDGRNTKGGHGHDQAGAMSLRAGIFNTAGQMLNEFELDNRVCDCCQTDAALIPGGFIVAYRDRSDKEFRDISVLRWQDGQAAQPSGLQADGWKIAGCPVNGPAIASRGEDVVLAWFTAAQDTPRVMLAFSRDAGVKFALPIRIDEGHPLGRVDVCWLNEEQAAISWMEEIGAEAEIKVALVNKAGKRGASFSLARNSSSRSSGFPILEAVEENRLLAAWTHADTLTTRVRSAMINWN